MRDCLIRLVPEKINDNSFFGYVSDNINRDIHTRGHPDL
mgnify:CR=1 FL=1